MQSALSHEQAGSAYTLRVPIIASTSDTDGEPVAPVPATGNAPVDVVILGGGPAGAAAARLIAGWGHRVVLLTRPSARQTLGESLPPSAGKLLDRIGVSAAVDGARFVRATGNTVWWGTAAARVERFPGGALGWQLPRGAFDRLMLAEAEGAGARIVRGAVVREVVPGSPETSGTVVRYELGGRQGSITARWVLDCTGRVGLLARRGWRRPDPSGRTLALVGIWERRDGWEMLDDDTHTLVESYGDGWAWSVPVSRERRYVTVMVDPALTAVRSEGESAGLATIYRSELAKAAQLDALAHAGRWAARLTAAPFARDASSYTATRFAEDGVLLVGDAASFVDPLSSYGIKKALSSAWLASVVVHTVLLDAAMRQPALELYDRREREMHDGLRRRFADLSRDAAGEQATDFWRARAAGDAGEDAEPDVAALRSDPEVLAALDAMRRRTSIALRASPGVQRVERPVVRGDRVALEEHLVVPAFRDGVRYIRSIDLATLVALAPAYEQVPELYAAYNRAAPPASLPDFLGALSVLVAKGLLDLA
jgi:flavin-dependent dehydrogenase